jgi:hypothetical protein
MTPEMILKAAHILKIFPKASYDIPYQKREVAEVQTPLMFKCLKGLSHEIDFKNFDKNLQNLA